MSSTKETILLIGIIVFIINTLFMWIMIISGGKRKSLQDQILKDERMKDISSVGEEDERR